MPNVARDNRFDVWPPLSAHQTFPIIKRIPKRSETVDLLAPIAAVRVGAMRNGNHR